ncbi:MAG TPA: hypothetical protein VIL32_13025 [Steroidobacteraceae bacterium]
MSHTFLFQPGRWSGFGTFWTADDKAVSAEGRTEISHRDDCWLIAGSLRVLSSPPVEFVTNYSICPPATPDATTLKWTSENPVLGKLHGLFTVIGPSILSVYHCSGSAYRGAEHLAQIDENTYEACGVLILEDRRLSSWRVQLSRVA